MPSHLAVPFYGGGAILQVHSFEDRVLSVLFLDVQHSMAATGAVINGGTAAVVTPGTPITSTPPSSGSSSSSGTVGYTEVTEDLYYDPDYSHNEARISADGATVMLFRYDAFRICGMDGSVVADVEVPDAEQVYDQQFRREGQESWLEVIYNDGTIRRYSAADGTLLSEEQGAEPDRTLYEEFFTDHLKIISPLHGTPVAYDRETGELVRELEPDAYLTYVTQVGDYVVTEYISAQGQRYGLLLDGQCRTLAELPDLCDILADGTLVFDDMRGNLRQCRIYSMQELLTLADQR